MSDTGRKRRRPSGRPADADLSGVPAAQLQAELARRQRRVRTLARRYDRLMKGADALRSEIAALGGSAGAAKQAAKLPGSRPRNDLNLVEALKRAMGGRAMSVTEAAQAVQKAGYRTTSPSFRRIVNITFIRSGAFERVGRGRYRVK